MIDLTFFSFTTQGLFDMLMNRVSGDVQTNYMQQTQTHPELSNDQRMQNAVSVSSVNLLTSRQIQNDTRTQNAMQQALGPPTTEVIPRNLPHVGLVDINLLRKQRREEKKKKGTEKHPPPATTAAPPVVSAAATQDSRFSCNIMRGTAAINSIQGTHHSPLDPVSFASVLAPSSHQQQWQTPSQSNGGNDVIELPDSQLGS
jgi:hypothetical protein